jgi:hypothetical protein
VTSVNKRKLLAQKKENSYQKIRDLERNEANAIIIKETMNNTNEDIESLTRRIKELIIVSQEAKKNQIKEIEDDFIEVLTKMRNETTLTLKHFQKKIIK